MTFVSLLVVLFAILPVFGLAVLGWLAMEDDTGDLCAMVNVNGLWAED
jgi:hypothetical protein